MNVRVVIMAVIFLEKVVVSASPTNLMFLFWDEFRFIRQYVLGVIQAFPLLPPKRIRLQRGRFLIRPNGLPPRFQ